MGTYRIFTPKYVTLDYVQAASMMQARETARQLYPGRELGVVSASPEDAMEFVLMRSHSLPQEGE